MVFVFNHTTNQQRTEEEIKVLKSMFPKKQLVMRNYPLPKIDNSMTIEEIAKDFAKILFINKFTIFSAVIFCNFLIILRKLGFEVVFNASLAIKNQRIAIVIAFRKISLFTFIKNMMIA